MNLVTIYYELVSISNTSIIIIISEIIHGHGNQLKTRWTNS